MNRNYHLITKYLSNELDEQELQNSINNELLIQVLKRLKPVEIVHTNSEPTLTLAKAENYLEQFLKNDLSNADAAKLKSALLTSRYSAERFLHKVNTIHEDVQASMNNRNHTNLTDAFSLIFKSFIETTRKEKNGSGLSLNKTKSQRSFVRAILSTAAILLVLFIIPLEFTKDLHDLYDFDEALPVEYDQSVLRGSASIENAGSNQRYIQFRYDFNNGLTEYLSKNYRVAAEQFDQLVTDLPALRDIPGFTEKDEKDLILYNALSYMALSVTKRQHYSDDEKQQARNKAIEYFQKIPVQSDTINYYYSLTLALNGQHTKALQTLSQIGKASKFYEEKVILEQQLIH